MPTRTAKATWEGGLKNGRGSFTGATGLGGQYNFSSRFENGAGSNPEELLAANIEASLLRQALEELPLEFREVIVLRELEGLSYKEISGVTSVPIGTVMSRLARGRCRLQKLLRDRMQKGGAA